MRDPGRHASNAEESYSCGTWQLALKTLCSVAVWQAATLPDLVSPPHLCRIIDYDVLLDDVLPDDAPGAAARTH